MICPDAACTGPGAGRDEDALEKVEGHPLLRAPVLVHVGMIKAGSTWLQENLFGRDDTGFWSPSDITMRPKARVKAHTYALYEDDRGRLLVEEDFDAESVRARLAAFAVPADRCAVFSNERLSGHPLSNGIDRRMLSERIKRVFPNARILLVFREQRSMILSNYMQYLKNGGAHNVKGYLDGKWNSNQPSLTMHYFKYDRIINDYHCVFGERNVLALPFEMLTHAPQRFVDSICGFVNVNVPQDLPFDKKANQRGAYFSYVFFRRLVPLIRSSRGNGYSPTILGHKHGKTAHLGMVRATSVVVPNSLDRWMKDRLLQEIEEITKDAYAMSNRATQELTGIDLRPLGYRV